LQLCSDVFGIPVYQSSQNPNSAALGAAFRAKSCYLKTDILELLPKDSILVATPNAKFQSIYDELGDKHERLEAGLVE
jgi:sugar (pentulose or hexulose) kinase